MSRRRGSHFPKRSGVNEESELKERWRRKRVTNAENSIIVCRARRKLALQSNDQSRAPIILNIELDKKKGGQRQLQANAAK